jgi:hypothetical protein
MTEKVLVVALSTITSPLALPPKHPFDPSQLLEDTLEIESRHSRISHKKCDAKGTLRDRQSQKPCWMMV